jgi:hypothetical protein
MRGIIVVAALTIALSAAPTAADTALQLPAPTGREPVGVTTLYVASGRASGAGASIGCAVAGAASVAAARTAASGTVMVVRVGRMCSPWWLVCAVGTIGERGLQRDCCRITARARGGRVR